MKKYIVLLAMLIVSSLSINCSNEEKKTQKRTNNLIKELEVRTTLDSPETTNPNLFFYISKTNFTYNSTDQITTISSQQDFRSMWEYDHINNIYPNKHKQRKIERIFTYNPKTNLLEKETTIINNVSTSKTFIYNDNKQIIKINELGKKTTLEYNTKGQVNKIITKYDDPYYVYNATKEYEYDANNNVISINYDYGFGPEKYIIKYTNVEGPFKNCNINYTLQEPLDEGLILEQFSLFSERYATLFENLEYSYKGYHLIKGFGSSATKYNSGYITFTDNNKLESFDYFRAGQIYFQYSVKKTY